MNDLSSLQTGFPEPYDDLATTDLAIHLNLYSSDSICGSLTLIPGMIFIILVLNDNSRSRIAIRSFSLVSKGIHVRSISTESRGMLLQNKFTAVPPCNAKAFSRAISGKMRKSRFTCFLYRGSIKACFLERLSDIQIQMPHHGQ